MSVWKEHLEKAGKENVPERDSKELDFYQRSKSISTKRQIEITQRANESSPRGKIFNRDYNRNYNSNIDARSGAWLANAIRDEYGLPPAYEKAKIRAKEEHLARTQAAIQNARKSHEGMITEDLEARLGETYRQLEKTHSDKLRAFNEYVEEERARGTRIMLSLSPKRREEYLATFDKPEGRLRLFGNWMKKLGSISTVGRTPEHSG